MVEADGGEGGDGEGGAEGGQEGAVDGVRVDGGGVGGELGPLG